MKVLASIKTPRAILAIALAAVLLGACEGHEADSPGTATTVTISNVVTRKVEPVTVTEYVEVSGTVRPVNRSVVSSRVMGLVLAVHAEEGGTVKKGALLLTLDGRELEARARAAEEGLSEAERAQAAARERLVLANRTHYRYEALHAGRAVTDQEFDTVSTERKVAALEIERATARRESARASLDEARAYQGYSTITAPISGIVTERRIEAGDMATPGAPLLVIEDHSRLEVRAEVDERYSGAAHAGTPVRVIISSADREFAGSISDMIPSVDPASRTFEVKVQVRGEGIRSGMYAKVRLPVGDREALFVPSGAIVRRGQLTGVFVVGAEKRVSYRLIKAGADQDAGTEVLSGLSVGETVIIEGAGRAVEGGVLE